jgi:hypothetical protein
MPAPSLALSPARPASSLTVRPHRARRRLGLLAILLALLLSGCARGPSVLRADAGRDASARFFHEVHDGGDARVYETLARAGGPGRFVEVVEYDAAYRPVGDTLRAWVQHVGAGGGIAPEAYEADLVVTCYPDRLDPRLRPRHVLPKATGAVWVYFLADQFFVVRARRDPALGFVVAHHQALTSAVVAERRARRAGGEHDAP